MGSVRNQYVYTDIHEIIMHEWRVCTRFAHIFMNNLMYIFAKRRYIMSVWSPAPDSTVGTAVN